MKGDALPDIGVRHLDAIASLARFGSFIAAANHLGISQPGLSRIIQQAERKLGARLFVRGTRSVSLTAAGREFLPFAERMVGDFTRQAEKLRASHSEPEARLTIASLMSVSHLVLPSALVQFRHSHPKVAVEVREGVGSTVNEDVRSGVVDFGIGHTAGAPPGIITESVMEEAFLAVLPADHPLATREMLRLADLEGLPLASMPLESGLRRAIDEAVARVGVNLNHSVVTNQYASLFSFVANGLGITLVPASALPSADDTRLAVRALNTPITRQIAVMHRADRPLNTISEAFLRLLRPLLGSATQGMRQRLPHYG